MNRLDQPAAVDLTGCTSIAATAGRESWDPDRYAISLAENIRNSGVLLDSQRERLAALAGAGAAAGQASADELARHYSILEALYHRFAHAAIEAMNSGLPRASETADRYLSASLRCQKAALACLSALKVLRDGQQPIQAPTTPMAMPAAVADPATGPIAT